MPNAVAEQSPGAEEQNDIDEIIVRFEALVGPECVIGGSGEADLKLHIGPPPDAATALPGRLVFLRKHS